MKNLSAGREKNLWKTLFFSLLAFYCCYYAPYGVNETDGGFLTGLAWQILQGKRLYGDILYVRPPLPVWLRALEMQLLPDHWAIIGERCIFYLKVGVYSWMGASILAEGSRRWVLATLGFVISVHCYPPMAWHTTDGLLFAVSGIWCAVKIRRAWGVVPAAATIFAAVLCKQSFYALPAIFILLLAFDRGRRAVGWGIGSLLLFTALFFSYLHTEHLFENYFKMTGGATTVGQALQHGLFDYFRIKPALAVPGILLLLPVAWHIWKRKNTSWAFYCWLVWLLLLMVSYTGFVFLAKDFTPPFAQARLMFWIGLASVFLLNARSVRSIKIVGTLSISTPAMHLAVLLAVSWCASVSWGYNLPILFSTPWVFAGMEITRLLAPKMRWNIFPALNLVGLALLLAVFRIGYEYVYRDGSRSTMSAEPGSIFPRSAHIYSNAETVALYSDLKNLAARYPNFKTLPSFPQANYLTGTYPPLPLDWVVSREMNSDTAFVMNALRRNNPVLLIEKRYDTAIKTDPELALTRFLLQSGTVVDETPYFWVVKLELRVIRGH